MAGYVGKPVRRRLRGWFLLGAAGACLLAAGCTGAPLRGERFASDDTFDWAGTVRKPDAEVEYFGFSNKARQIERDLGARE
ncbi:MAG: hypothetical protein JW809_04490 [Pirellulales bacterium]|nr:hypothetical protein [Pirellulales bacterium]